MDEDSQKPFLKRLVPLGMSAHIVREKRGITPDTALRLARFFGEDAGSWLNLQQDYDLKLTARAFLKIIEAEVAPLELAH